MKLYALIIFTVLQVQSLSIPKVKPLKAISQGLATAMAADSNFIEVKLEDNELYFGIPVAMLNQPMLLVNHFDGLSIEFKNIVWKIHDHRIFLESSSSVQSSSGVIIPVEKDQPMSQKIISIFPILKEKKTDNKIWIIATDLFTDYTMTKWNLFSELRTQKEHSRVTDVKYLPNEIIVRTLQVGSEKGETWSSSIDFSIYLLPEPMTPRFFDHRMGFSSEDQSSSSTINYKPESPLANITRWRLEKKDSDLAMSEPIKPITFYLPMDIPQKWRPYVKAGIMEWLPAFEAAGFKNALVVKEVSHEDPDLHFNSVNSSMVRWGDQRDVRGFENAEGGTVMTIVDLRSGEILKSDLFIGASYVSLMDRYFVSCAPLDNRTLHYPFPDELTGALIQSLVAHEAGHAFGLRDGHYGEYAYPFEKMRDAEWLKIMGHTPSIMTYARNNNLPQPKDSIPPSLLIQRVGPTDIFSIRWAYTPYDDTTPNVERDALEAIVREQDSVAWYRYNIPVYEQIGPGSTNEVVENNDPIKSTELGLANLKSVIELLPIVNQNRKDYALIERLYGQILTYWYKQMEHVMSLIGGYQIQYKSPSQLGDVYTPIPRTVQEEAMTFLIKHAFSAPEWLVNPSFSDKFKYSTYRDQLIEYQKLVLLELISQRRMKRFGRMEFHTDYKGISHQMLTTLQSGLFAELNTANIKLDPRKQEIQRIYIDALQDAISQKGGTLNAVGNTMYDGRSKSLFMNNLVTLKKELSKHLRKNMDPETSGHLKLLLHQMDGLH